MFINFRQGIIRYNTPLLTKTALSNTSVDLNVVPNQPVLVTHCHYGANYLIAINVTLVGAWGSGAIGSTNGPLPMNQTEYLYWDIDIGTGALTYGWTLYAPIYSSVAPVNPQIGQMWFDTVNTVFNVWQQFGHAPGAWVNCIRVFAGIYYSNATLVPFPVGSQVQPPINGNFTAGNILLGTNLVPLRNSDGTFVNTSQQLLVNQTSGQNIVMDAALIFGEASEPIPAFYLVTFQYGKMITLASCLNYTNFVNGIVTQPLDVTQVGQVLTGGLIVNQNWSWPQSSIGLPLFCDPTGLVTLTPPTIGVTQQVGVVYDTNAIQLSIGPAVRIRT